MLKKLSNEIEIKKDSNPLIFPNGSIYFKKNLTFKKFKTNPIIIHVNCINGVEAKIDVLKKFNYWNS